MTNNTKMASIHDRVNGSIANSLGPEYNLSPIFSNTQNGVNSTKFYLHTTKIKNNFSNPLKIKLDNEIISIFNSATRLSHSNGLFGLGFVGQQSNIAKFRTSSTTRNCTF